jgi:hypothetical protein
MKIKFLTAISGPDYSYLVGDVVDWKDESEAQRLTSVGIAEVVATGTPKKTTPAVETAAVTPSEKAIKPSPRKRTPKQ